MRISFICLGLILVGAQLVGCSGPSKTFADERMPQTLEVDILPNNSKMFVYRVGVSEELQGDHVRIARGGFSDREGNRETGGGYIPVSRSTPEQLKERAEYVVKQMGYCREGFLLIDSSFSPRHAWMKGECKEDASAEDRNKFGGKKILPVKLGN